MTMYDVTAIFKSEPEKFSDTEDIVSGFEVGGSDNSNSFQISLFGQK